MIRYSDGKLRWGNLVLPASKDGEAYVARGPVVPAWRVVASAERVEIREEAPREALPARRLSVREVPPERDTLMPGGSR